MSSIPMCYLGNMFMLVQHVSKFDIYSMFIFNNAKIYNYGTLSCSSSVKQYVSYKILGYCFKSQLANCPESRLHWRRE